MVKVYNGITVYDIGFRSLVVGHVGDMQLAHRPVDIYPLARQVFPIRCTEHQVATHLLTYAPHVVGKAVTVNFVNKEKSLVSHSCNVLLLG